MLPEFTSAITTLKNVEKNLEEYINQLVKENKELKIQIVELNNKIQELSCTVDKLKSASE